MKKIIASVLVRDNIVVNSINFNKYRPIGSIEQIITRLQDWEVDEIVVLNLTHSENPLADFNLLFSESLLSTIHTPLAFGGGITSRQMAESIIAAGCERIILSGAKWTPEKSREISVNLGDQAILIHLPLVQRASRIVVHGTDVPIYNYFEEIPADWGGEIFLKDKEMDGSHSRMTLFSEISEMAKELKTPILIGGGLSSFKSVEDFFALKYVKGVVIGNWFNRDELIVPRLKSGFGKSLDLRSLVRYG